MRAKAQLSLVVLPLQVVSLLTHTPPIEAVPQSMKVIKWLAMVVLLFAPTCKSQVSLLSLKVFVVNLRSHIRSLLSTKIVDAELPSIQTPMPQPMPEELVVLR